MRTFFRTCILLVAFAGSSHAADPTPASSRLVSLRVLAFKGLVTDLEVHSPSGRTRIVAKASTFGPVIQAIAEAGMVDFFNHSSQTPAPPSPADGLAPTPEPPVASFTADPEVDRYLVIVTATGEGAERRFSAYAIPDTKETLTPGQARIINFTNGPLAVQLGASRALIQTAKSSVLPCPPETDGHTNLRLARSAGDSKWELVDSTRVAVPDGRRLLVLITPAPPPGSGDIVAGGALNIRIVLDTPPTPSGQG